MSKLLVIGCGGVAGVAIAKCCQNSDVFTELCIASRTKSKCDAVKEKLQPTTSTVITTAQVDADSKEQLVQLIKAYQPDAVLNVALPYQDLTIMDACLECKVDYIDTANYEPETLTILHGVQFMTSAARKRASLLTLIIPGNGLIKKNLSRPASWLCSAPALTPVLPVFSLLMH